jgi:hypothetical protein
MELDFDEELEIIANLAMEEKYQHQMVVLKNVAYSSGVIACKPGKIFFMTILLNHQYILTNIFEGDLNES